MTLNELIGRHWSLIATESHDKAHDPGKISGVRSFGKVRYLLFRSLCWANAEKIAAWMPKIWVEGTPYHRQKKKIYFLNKTSQQILHTRAQTKCLLTYRRPWAKWVPPCCPWKTQRNRQLVHQRTMLHHQKGEPPATSKHWATVKIQTLWSQILRNSISCPTATRQNCAALSQGTYCSMKLLKTLSRTEIGAYHQWAMGFMEGQIERKIGKIQSTW